MSTLLRRSAALPVLLLVLHGCAVWPTDPQARGLRELDRNRRLWESRGVADYDYRVMNFCFCPEDYRGPVAVEVRDDSTLSAVYVAGGAPARPEPFASMDRVEDLFDTVSRALARDPAEAEVVYDPELGYPRSASFDFERNVADEEGGFSVTGFELR
jgi:hypothetical protein